MGGNVNRYTKFGQNRHGSLFASARSISTYMWKHAYTHICAHPHVCMRAHINTHTRAHTHAYAHGHTHACARAQIDTRTHEHTHARTNTHTRARAHTLAHTDASGRRHKVEAGKELTWAGWARGRRCRTCPGSRPPLSCGWGESCDWRS